MANNRKPNFKSKEDKSEQRNSSSAKPRNSRKSRNSRSNRDLESETNDPSWYATDPALIRDVASFPFSRPVGTPIGFKYRANEPISGSIPSYTTCSVAGVYRVLLQTTCGLSQNATSAVNVAAQAMYSFVRHANSGHSNYEACDLMIYMLANSQIYGCINWLQRVYGTALMYSQRNRWIPKYLLISDGIDCDDIVRNLANFRYGINLLVNKAAALAVPNSFTLFNRHAFLYQNYYIEGPTVKDQIYYFAPNLFYQFGLNATDSSGELQPAISLNGVNISGRKPSSLLTAQDLLDYANGLIDKVLEQEDFGIMSGDILKAYGQNIIKLASINEDYSLGFLQDEAVLMQIKNCTPILNASLTFPNQNIYQSDGIIKYEPTIQCGNNERALTMLDIMGTSMPLVSNNTEVTPEEVIESSRLMMALIDNQIQPTAPLLVHGSEIVHSASAFKIWFAGTTSGLTSNHCNYVQFMNWDINGAMNELVRANFMAPFKYHNSVVSVYPHTTDDVVKWKSAGPLFDYDNYTLLSVDELQRMHDACLFNMLHVPAIAKANAK